MLEDARGCSSSSMSWTTGAKITWRKLHLADALSIETSLEQRNFQGLSCLFPESRASQLLGEYITPTRFTMPTKEEKREKAREVVDILEEISVLLVSFLSSLISQQQANHANKEHAAGSGAALAMCLSH